MRYFIDTEFWETPGEITWISVGIVAEDGRELYFENDIFPWSLVDEYAVKEGPEGDTPRWLLENVWPQLRRGDHEMSSAEARDAMSAFFGDDESPEFWAWYGDYDWVVFCWLWGRMIDLPKHFPMFCRDFRQIVGMFGIRGKDLATESGQAHDALHDAKWLRDAFLVFEQRYADGRYSLKDILA
jgi:hypothetical protein